MTTTAERPAPTPAADNPTLGTRPTGRWTWLWWIAVLALAAPAIVPLFLVSLPVTHDGLNHLQRLVVFDSLFRSGVLYPRWYPDFATGYGYPLGTFYPPFALYVAEAFHVFGAGPTLALKLAFAASMLAGALGAYVLGRSLSRSSGGLLAAVAYTYAPYVLVTTYDRGALPEALALGVLPWAFWAAGRRAGRSAVPVLSITLGLLMLANTAVALLCWPLLLLWWFGVRLARREPVAWKQAAAAFAAALGLTAFYWLPAAAETGTVALDAFAGAAAANTVDLAALFDTRPLYDFSALPYRLGLAQILLAAVALVWVLASGSARRKHGLPALSAVFIAALSVLGASSLAAPLWAGVAPLNAVQFPWRLLGPAALAVAILAAFLGASWRSLALGGLLTLGLAASGLALLHPVDRQVDDRYLSVGSAVRREFTEGTIGTTTAAEYLPAVARGGYQPGRAADPSFSASDAPLTSATLRAFGPLETRLRVQTDAPTFVRLHLFWSPSWTADVDGKYAPVTPQGPLGLVSVPVPAGEHLVTVRSITSPFAWAGIGISIVTFMALGFVLGIGWGAVATGIVITVGLVGFWTSLARVQASVLLPAELGEVRVLGGSLQAAPEGHVRVTLLWQATNAAPKADPLRVQLVRPNGDVVSERTGAAVWGTSPASSWAANEIVRDERLLRLPEGGAGQLDVLAGYGDRLEKIGSVRYPVAPPRPLPAVGQVSDAQFGQRLRLEGVTVNGAANGVLIPGSRLDLSLVWTALRDVEDDYTAFVHLIGPNGTRYAQSDSQPAAGLAPTSLWAPGESLEDWRTLTLPADLPPGEYSLQVGWYLLKTGERLPRSGGDTGTTATIGSYKVASHQALPTGMTSVNTQFGAVTLAGYMFDPHTLTLAWQVAGSPGRDYTVFVHLLDANGALVAQADHQPRNGSYRTSLWSAGETIIDTVELPDAPGAVSLRVGLYDPRTGERVTAGSGDSVTMPLQ